MPRSQQDKLARYQHPYQSQANHNTRRPDEERAVPLHQNTGLCPPSPMVNWTGEGTSNQQGSTTGAPPAPSFINPHSQGMGQATGTQTGQPPQIPGQTQYTDKVGTQPPSSYLAAPSGAHAQGGSRRGHGPKKAVEMSLQATRGRPDRFREYEPQTASQRGSRNAIPNTGRWPVEKPSGSLAAAAVDPQTAVDQTSHGASEGSFGRLKLALLQGGSQYPPRKPRGSCSENDGKGQGSFPANDGRTSSDPSAAIRRGETTR
ncbi:hypothetical protein BV25DRAFT_1842655 [Artomyces pyxidatus]|uniref:Uncharacterized protein n=1 Tax=Artomyces pyxidatus TaxID=48021 RepID=A0ACB8SJ22_9AGAM|nr:hypothetical protein BV25DRAFT_1842655 [Artomyces pyxidatus]